LRITAVPLNEADLVRRGHANGFTLTEAWSPPRRIPPHAHQELSITILLEGCFEERYRPIHKPHELHPGSLVVRPAGEVHANHLGMRGGRTLSDELDPTRLEVYGEPLRPCLSLLHRREALFLDIGLAMSQELRHADEATGLALESLGLELLARLVRVCQADETGHRPAWLERARRVIDDRFREPSLRVSDLASEQGVHPVYFARAFRRHYRTTPGDYVRRLRLEWARGRLTATREPLAAIALECGFSWRARSAAGSVSLRAGCVLRLLKAREHQDETPIGLQVLHRLAEDGALGQLRAGDLHRVAGLG
jgi:AraC family transcriptional regulator